MRGLLAFLGAMALGVWITGAGLPPVVASHFDARGIADGFLSRTAYLALTTGLVAVLPLAVVALPGLAAGRGDGLLNLPHRAYWLAPERRAATLAWLRGHCRWLAVALSLLMGWLHVQVVLAQGLQPPRMTGGVLPLTLGVFLVAVLAWTGVLLRRFRRR